MHGIADVPLRLPKYARCSGTEQDSEAEEYRRTRGGRVWDYYEWDVSVEKAKAQFCLIHVIEFFSARDITQSAE